MLIAKAAVELTPNVPRTNNADAVFVELSTFFNNTRKTLKAEAKPDTTDYKALVVALYDKGAATYAEARKKLVTGINDGSPSHCLKWQTETVMRLEEADVLMRHAVARLNGVSDSATAKAKIEEYIQWLTRNILRLPPKHNSTSEVDNLLGLCSNEAKCNVVVALYETIGTEL